MRFLNTFLVSVALCCLGVGGLNAQIDYTTQTLSFDNITASNVNQTVNEVATNEKDIDFGDYDNDGDVDVVIAIAESDFGQRRNKLYRNDNGVLNEVSGAPVIPGFSNTDTSRSAFFRDYNNDGLLDIIIVNDSNSGTGSNDAPGKTKLYLQNGSGVFVNTSQNLANQTGAACSGISADFDGNGLDDLMMCNYPNTSQDSLGLNGINGNSAGLFTEVTGTNYPVEGGYGVHSEGADMNGDGTLDILLANWTGTAAFIYYNNNNGAGSGDGDFSYAGTGSNSSFPSVGGGDERGMFPADFNNDGLMDFYFANRGLGTSTRSDFLAINTGNDANNRAMFSFQQMPTVHDSETYKVNCNDLDGDGLVDLVVMSNLGIRPYVYRNTSAGGTVSFIEWTPANITNTHRGWQANSADITGNGRPDILFGANANEHLFENVQSSEFDFDALGGGVLPAFHNLSPIAVSGVIEAGETLLLIAQNLAVPVGARVSVMLRSEADLSLSATVNGNSVGSSARSGEGVAEAFQFLMPANGPIVFSIENLSKGVLIGDVNGDGVVNLLDVTPFVQLISSMGFLEEADINGDGVVNLLDVQPFVDVITNGGGEPTESDFVIEFLSRT